MSDEAFAFGKNWKNFSRVIDDESITSSMVNIRDLLQVQSLEGVSFLDIGCGSGLSSLAALRLGATVRAFDYDPKSVEAAQTNLSKFEPGGDWSVERGSALDPDYMASLGSFDIVYSWGVLHHTGGMWAGINLAAMAVRPGGKLTLAIYNDQGGASSRWRTVKRLYMRSPTAIRWLLVLLVGLYFETRAAAIRLIRLQNPLPFGDWRRRKKERGMSVWHDLVDWVGGYPFEVAKPEQIFDFLHARGFAIEGMATCAGGHGCNEFLFRRTLAEEAGGGSPPPPVGNG